MAGFLRRSKKWPQCVSNRCKDSFLRKKYFGVRGTLNVGKGKNSCITSILDNKKSVDDPQDIANIFSDVFANVDKTTEKEISKVNHSPSVYLTN